MGLIAISPFINYNGYSIGNIRNVSAWQYTWCKFYWPPAYQIGGFTWRLNQNNTIRISTGPFTISNPDAELALKTRNTRDTFCQEPLLSMRPWTSIPVSFNNYYIYLEWYPWMAGKFRWEVQAHTPNTIYTLAVGGTNVYMPRGTYAPTQLNGNWVDAPIIVSSAV
jgi:hypothetical protein